MTIEIREERAEDIPAVRTINERAFGQPQEADLVDILRKVCTDFISLVASVDGHPVGHVLFTPAIVECGGAVVRGMGLAPVAVLPEHQRRGIGIRLIEEGLGMLRTRNCPFVIVLGHPEYYPRFGFKRASRFGLRSQWEGIPDAAFMAIVMDDKVMRGVEGVARYRDEFDMAM